MQRNFIEEREILAFLNGESVTGEKKKYHRGITYDDCMPFCTTCGKEAAPGKKFCEYCGTPLEQPLVAPAAPTPPPPVVPAAPFSPSPAPIPSSGGSGKTMVIAGIVVVLVIIAGVYFIGLQIIRGSSGTRSTLQQATTLPTGALTPFPTSPSTKISDTSGIATNPTPSQTYEEKYTETYNLVYSVNHAFNGGQKEIFTQDLITPPLYIKFNITPKMFYGERTVDIGLSSEHVVNLSYISPDAWFKVQVYDADNGMLKDEQGFNKGYSIMTIQEFMVRAPGNYRVEMTGNDVTAEVRILTGNS